MLFRVKLRFLCLDLVPVVFVTGLVILRGVGGQFCSGPSIEGEA